MCEKNKDIVSSIGGPAIDGFTKVISSFLGPTPMDNAIAETHKKILFNAIGNRSDSDAFAFVCGYNQLIKQEHRKRDIADKARQFLSSSPKPEKIDSDWLEFFFEKAKLIRNNEMQLIWAKLLAEEANEPGKITLALLHAISIMRFDLAEFFCNISKYAFRSFKKPLAHPLLFVSTEPTAYKDQKITADRLRELERLGLIQCNFENEYVFHDKQVFVFGNRMITILGDPSNHNKIKAGNVILTQDGQALYDIIDPEYKKFRKGIFEFLIRRFKEKNCKVFIDGREVF